MTDGRRRLAGGWAGVALLTLMVLARAAGAAAADDAVQAVRVEKAEPVVEYKRFDPADPPSPPPPLGPGEAAVCVYEYGVAVDSHYSYTKAPAAGGSPVALDVKIQRVTVKLSLDVTIWLPTTASKALAAHEEGHRTIAQTFYADADKTARALAGKWVGKTAAGAGKDADAAGRAAVHKVNQALCDSYLEAMNGPCGKAQAAFDRLTDHGRKDRPTADEAVARALKEAREK